MIIHQVIMGAANGDAITSMALRLQAAFRLLGPSEVFAIHIAPEMTGAVRQVLDPGALDNADVVVYHSSLGDPRLTQILLNLQCPLALHYHNITPYEYFLGVNETLAMSSLWAREELKLLKDRVAAASADSRFNAGELEALGYSKVKVGAFGLCLENRLEAELDRDLLEDLKSRFPAGFGLIVSQQLPHKRTEIAIAATGLAQKVHNLDVGLVIVGGSPAPEYVRRLKLYAEILMVDRCEFWGRTADKDLVTALHSASFLLTVSDHEGLAIPPIEAMVAGTPVIARGTAALPDTVGRGGVVLPADAGPELVAAAIAELDQHPNVVDALRADGYQRALEHSEMADPWSYLEQIRALVA
jgi:glycosyltransferase involved in cell wall biosynthesis